MAGGRGEGTWLITAAHQSLLMVSRKNRFLTQYVHCIYNSAHTHTIYFTECPIYVLFVPILYVYCSMLQHVCKPFNTCGELEFTV